MRARALVFSVAVLMCLSTSTAMADLFDFSIINPLVTNTYGGVTSTFTAEASSAVAVAGTEGSLVGQSGPALGDVAHFLWDAGASEGGSFSLTMTISNIDSTLGSESADGTGSFVFTDSTGDTITADLTGTWDLTSTGQNHFDGTLSTVLWNDEGGDGLFNGGPLSNVLYSPNTVDMGFASPMPWGGTIVEITTGASGWFDQDFAAHTGSIDAIVTPTPAAVLLGILGLGVAGWKLRKYA